MITAFELTQINKTIKIAEEVQAIEMPMAKFILVGVDSCKVYFRVSCKLKNTSEAEIKNMTEKTRFHPIEENIIGAYYLGEFSIDI